MLGSEALVDIAQVGKWYCDDDDEYALRDTRERMISSRIWRRDLRRDYRPDRRTMNLERSACKTVVVVCHAMQAECSIVSSSFLVSSLLQKMELAGQTPTPFLSSSAAFCSSLVIVPGRRRLVASHLDQMS